ncbi:hypothetical protein [Methylomagnum sp.]
MSYRRILLLLLPLLINIALARPLPPEQVPEPLKPWTEWALWDQQAQTCPFANGSPDERRCVWPTRLELNLDERGGRFSLTVRVYAEQWAGLPGDAEHWPQDVQADGKPAVLQNNGEALPGLVLAPGIHNITGRYAWDRLPENLHLPDNTGLVALAVGGKPVPIPVINEQGQLWIHDDGAKPASAEITDTLALKVYRQINDGVPVQVATHLELDVSGRSQEILLQGALLENAIPLRVDSPLPARLEPDGRLRMQARPGHWAIDITARLPGEVASLKLPEYSEPWPREEIWVYAAQPSVRLVEIEGVPTVDPRQTELPNVWKVFPAYRLEPGNAMSFKQIRRGDPEPEPDALTLHRKIWLDFDGQGYTVNDVIGGRMTRGWRLNAQPGTQLGRVSIDNEPQSITRDEQTDGVGVEVRHGNLNLSADSRLAGTRAFPATGWNQDFQQLSAELNLPPGWKLFTTTGVDEAPGTWTSAWTLLDLFVVLIASLAVARLFNWPSAALALAALLLLWHEPDAPRYVWLNLLAAIALLRVLPAGRFATGVRWYRNLTVLALALIAVPFMVDQIRLGLYPQLQPPWPIAYPTSAADAMNEQAAGMMAPAPEADSPMRPRALREESKAFRKSLQGLPASAPPAAQTLREIDPNALTQTGPGLPQWQWSRIVLTWNGPVLRTQEVGLVLLSPVVNLALNVLRVLLLLGLAGLLVSGKFNWRGFKPGGAAPLLLVPLLLFLPSAKGADFPDPRLLDELRTRLLDPPDCGSDCAEIPLLKLDASPTELRQILEIHTLAKVGVPLPAQLGQWLPSRAEVDGQPAQGLFRDEGGSLWLLLDPGRHMVTLTGPLPPREQVQLPLPLKPHRVEATGQDWQVEGIRENGVPDTQLQLIRTTRDQRPEAPATLEARPLPPFLTVERTVRLGLDWRVDTAVRRVGPDDSPVSVDIPLLPGESVVTGGLHVRDGKIAVNLPPGQTELGWQSVLEKQPAITLKAPDTSDWAEVWRADVSPVWHMRSEGLVVIHHANPAGQWAPEWRPWPGESATLHITRPAGVPGNTLTIDSSDLNLNPGERATDATLTVSLRGSQGGQHAVTLPDGAALQSVTIDGALQPIRQQGRSVSLPINPGVQTASLVWRSETGIVTRLRAPEVNLGAASVNASTHITLGRDRWALLLGGPALGPAVLFWGVLAVIVLLALRLGRLPLTPLKSWQWALLLVGLSQAPVLSGVMVVGWLLALAWRAKAGRDLDDSRFNVLQISLALLSLAALAVLLHAVEQGLLGLPSMQIAGNDSDAYHLNWYQDQSGPALPQAWVVSVPLWVYRGLMLAWALWLAYSLLDWLRWGWGAYSADGLWRAWRRRVKEQADNEATRTED